MDSIVEAAIFVFGLAVILAHIEVNTEGGLDGGWARKSRTWSRVTTEAARIWGMFNGGRPLTGYHAGTALFTFLMFNFPFFFGKDWSLAAELSMMAIWMSWMVVWDFSWFILNPDVGIEKFKRYNIWWHSKKKWWRDLLPEDYIQGWFSSLVLAFLAAVLSMNFQMFTNQITVLLVFVVLLIAEIILAPYYKRWHKKMLEGDERDKLPQEYPGFRFD